MATIVKSFAPIVSDNASDQADQFVINYWGSLAAERMFPIPFWQVSRMLQASSSGEIALRIKNIQDSNAVAAQWMVFESALEDSLQDPVEQGIHYFIVEDKTFDGPILISGAGGQIFQIDGISQATGSPHNNVIRARIGKDALNDDYFVFFQTAECLILDHGGGGGALTGAKVPSTPG